MLSTLQGITLLLVVLILSRIVRYRQKLQAVHHLPGIRPPFMPLKPPGVLFKTSWWNMGVDAHWTLRRTLYKNAENVSVVPFLFGPPVLYTSNLDVARQVIVGGHKSDFIKPDSAIRLLSLWGMNLAAADTDIWRKHRRIVGPAFNNQLYASVWSFTATTYHDMMRAEGWEGAKEVDVSAMHALTSKLALLVIGRCGFGFPFNWSTPVQASNGGMSVNEAFRLIGEQCHFLIFTPKWFQDLRMKRFEPAMMAYEVLTTFMHEQVTKRREDIMNGVVDLTETDEVNIFDLILKANQGEDSKFPLNDLEVIGNVWVLLFAGHETTAHALAATLVCLSIYDDIQQDVYEQIKEVLDGRAEPTVEDYARLDKVLAVFYEALRMFPSAHLLIREATKDTVLLIPNPQGQDGTTSMPVSKGVQIVVDMVGVQYNPRYFDEPHVYKPARWYGVSTESETVTAFSVGPRACIGRRFATTEAVSFLTLLLRDWEVKPILNEGETKEQWRERALDAHVFVTLGIKDVPLRFVRRV